MRVFHRHVDYRRSKVRSRRVAVAGVPPGENGPANASVRRRVGGQRLGTDGSALRLRVGGINMTDIEFRSQHSSTMGSICYI